MFIAGPPLSLKKQKTWKRFDVARKRYLNALLNDYPKYAIVSNEGLKNSKFVPFEEALELSGPKKGWAIDRTETESYLARFFYSGWKRKSGAQRDF